jgi:hypothetical protein
MPTRKNIKSKKSNNKFRKTRSKRQTRKSKKKTRSKRGGGQVLSRFFNTEPDSPPPPPPSPEPPVCPICREVFNADSITITTACGHTFDTDCIRGWCRQRGEATECPLCRKPIGRTCIELLLFTDLEKILLDAITINRDGYSFVEAEYALQRGMDGTTLNRERLDINVKDRDGNTPLILAAENDDVEIVKLLLDYGADVDDLNDDGFDAYHVTENNDIINLLLENGYEPDENQEDAAVEASYVVVNRGGKRKQKKGKQKV